MTRFSFDDAHQLAREAFKLRVDDTEEEQQRARKLAPLVGKEEGLLAALIRAEIVYDEWLDEVLAYERVRPLIANFPSACERLSKHLKKALACWDTMPREMQYELACRTPDWQTSEDVADVISKFDHVLNEMLSCALECSEEEEFSTLGRPAGKSIPLEEFIKILRDFWLAEVSSDFGYSETTMDHEDGRREPTSAAARLVYAAAKVLDPDCNIGTVRFAMEAVHRRPLARAELPE